MLTFSLRPDTSITALEPRNGQVLVEMVQASKNNIIYQAEHDHAVVYGKVVSMPRTKLENSEIEFDRYIMFMKEHGARMMINSIEYRIIKENLVLAVCS